MWTKTYIELDIDGDREQATEAVGRLLEDMLENDFVIAASASIERMHTDGCDAEPCTCKDTL